MLNFMFAVSSEEILDISKTDLEKALELFKDYVKYHSKDASTIEFVGSVLYAKRELKDWSLGDYVLEEDLTGLLNALRSSEVRVDRRTLELLEKVFRDFDQRIREGLERLDPIFLCACKKLPTFLEIDAKNFAENLINAYMMGTVPTSFGNLSELICISNSKEIVDNLKNLIRELVGKGESYYLKAYYVIRALELDMKEFPQIEKYADLHSKLTSVDPNSIDISDYQEMLNEFLNIKLEKSALKEKLSILASDLLKRGFDLSNLCDDSLICPKLVNVEKEPVIGASDFKMIVLISSASIVLTVVLIMRFNNPRVRLRRLKRKISKNPLNANLHLKMARIYEKLGMIEEAMNEYKIASDLIDSGADQS